MRDTQGTSKSFKSSRNAGITGSDAIRIAPSLLASDFARIESELARVEGADLIHIDIMDGHFVPNITVGPGFVECVRRVVDLPLDVHLMIERPEHFIGRFAEAGADIISVHAEGNPRLYSLLTRIRSYGCAAGVAINPATPVESVFEVLGLVDLVLVMTVDPGFGGQEFIPFALSKVRRLRRRIEELELGVSIEVDGGIDLETASRAVEAGARILVAGSSIFDSQDPAEAIRLMRQGFQPPRL